MAVRHKSKQGILLLSFMSSHLDRVTDDYFSRDPVGDTVSMSEQLLEGAFRQEALTGRRTAAPCWRRRVPAGGASRTQTGSYRIYVEGQSPGRHGGGSVKRAPEPELGSDSHLQACRISTAWDEFRAALSSERSRFITPGC